MRKLLSANLIGAALSVGSANSETTQERVNDWIVLKGEDEVTLQKSAAVEQSNGELLVNIECLEQSVSILIGVTVSSFSLPNNREINLTYRVGREVMTFQGINEYRDGIKITRNERLFTFNQRRSDNTIEDLKAAEETSDRKEFAARISTPDDSVSGVFNIVGFSEAYNIAINHCASGSYRAQSQASSDIAVQIGRSRICENEATKVD